MVRVRVARQRAVSHNRPGSTGGVHVRVYMCVHVCMCVHVSICVHVCMCVYVGVCVRVCVGGGEGLELL